MTTYENVVGSFVDACACGVSFKVLDPQRYPYHQNHWIDEIARKGKHWSGLGPRDVVVDLGASWGGWTLPALAQGARVIAVEPSPVSSNALLRSVEANGWSDRLSLHRSLAWDDTPVPSEFYEHAVKNFGGSEDVSIKTVDAIVHDFVLANVLDAPPITRIKFDIEGAELPALRGARVAIGAFKPKLVIELHDVPADAPQAHLIPYTIGLKEKVLEVLGEFPFYRVTFEENGHLIIAEPKP